MKILMFSLRSHRGGQILERHLEGPVAVDADDERVGLAELDADGGRQAEAHGAQAAGGDELPGPDGLPVLGGEHLVLADAGGDEGLALGLLPDLLDHVLRHDVIFTLGRVAKRVLLPPVCDLLHPGSDVGPPRGREDLAGLLGELGKEQLEVADQRNGGGHQLGDLGRVDVQMDDLGLGGEGRELAGDAIVEAGAQRDDQVGVLDRVVGELGAVHAEHAQALRMGLGERALAVDGGHDRRAHQLDEAPAPPRRRWTSGRRHPGR